MIRTALTLSVTVPLGLLSAVVCAEEALRIRLNTVGYLPNQLKAASILGGNGRFAVLRISDGAVVLEGQLAPPKMNADTDEMLAIADFSALTSPGIYRLRVVEAGESAPFEIAADIYRAQFAMAARSFYLARCGTAVAFAHGSGRFGHDACHLDDAYLDLAGGPEGKRLACVGGWHDAGDYNKYVVNGCVTAGILLQAWEDFGPQMESVPLELPESQGGLPALLAEVKWELDWLLTMQAADGSVYHKVSTPNYGGFVMPEREGERRFVGAWGSSATANFAAVLAMASRSFAPHDPTYADRCLQAARRSYGLLESRPQYLRPSQTGFRTVGYDTHSDWDARLWAEAELWLTTGEDRFLAAFESRLRGARSRESGATSNDPNFWARRGPTRDVDVDWDWGNVKNLALIGYLFSERESRDAELVEGIRESLLAAADQIVRTAQEHGYSRPLGRRYFWGCNGSVARQAVVLEAARRLTDDETYRATQLDALNYLLGRNPYGRSFVTGLGYKPPMFPHDRRSGADDVVEPWPGYLVGGPHPRASDWRDVEEDYRTNEIAINWQGALLYALAAQLPEASNDK
jgi:endoglucanase